MTLLVALPAAFHDIFAAVPSVRDELRGRVRVLWIYSDEVRLSAATLRQLEEATRPSKFSRSA